MHAPEIDLPGLEWHNSPPLSLASLKGRVVILDFWTFCCINCMHILPTLKLVEEAFPNEVTVIGVHSPKFDAEKDGAMLAHAIDRYGIGHPVVHDPEMRLWRMFGVRAWPTLIFLSPTGDLAGSHSGEPQAQALLEAVSQMVDSSRDRGQLVAAPLPLPVAREEDSRLRFPGKIKELGHAPGLATGAWAVADSGHNQIVVFDDLGSELARFGRPEPGFDDGDSPSFNSPQGLICGEGMIYVADTGNHALRRLDSASGLVSTLAGNGLRGSPLPPKRPGPATALASPWDLELAGDDLYFANAGSHQLGRLDLGDGSVSLLAGSGAEGIVDGAALSSELAQPSALAMAPGQGLLYFADSETSSVRRLDLGGLAKVTTLVGSGLFDFGHGEGPFEKASLQHPLGLAWMDGHLAVADSYNGRLCLMDLHNRRLSELGSLLTCMDPVCLPPCEPAGVAAGADGRLLLADTNNHRILEYRPSQGSYRTWAC